MNDQQAQSRQESSGTAAVRLANGQTWAVPNPHDVLNSPDQKYVSQYLALLQDVRSAEDLNTQRLSELALSIHLIHHELQLPPSELFRLLCFTPNSVELTNFQDSIHAQYQSHIALLNHRVGAVVPTDAVDELSVAAEPVGHWITRLAVRLGRLFYRSDPRGRVV